MSDHTSFVADQHVPGYCPSAEPEEPPALAVKTWGNMARYMLIQACSVPNLGLLAYLLIRR